MWKKGIIVILVILNLVLGPGVFASLPKADLIKGSGPEVYLLESGTRHWIPDPETFNGLNYDWRNIKTISDNDLNKYPQEKDWKKYYDYPDGTLLRGSGPKVYLIELDKKRWIPSPSIFESNGFGWGYIIQIDDDDLDDYDDGDNLTSSEPNRYPETIILDGPEEGEIIEESEISFKYSGTNPLGPTNDLSFEIFLVGQDSSWRSNSSGEKRYTLSDESQSYTFYVRAKNKQGYIDSSPASISFSTGLSPYYDKVRISRVRPNESDFKKDYLTLENIKDEIINLTGWKIETKKGDIVIPQAVKKLKTPFSESSNSDIELGYRDKIIISSDLSPKGVNFQTNKCTGYFCQDSEFYPSLDKDCPDLEESEYSHLKKDCRDFIDRLGRCEIPDYISNFDIMSDSQCTGFLNETFTYQDCYDEHYQEVDFFEGQWRVFLNRDEDIFENDDDTIILKDKNGAVVDQYSY